MTLRGTRVVDLTSGIAGPYCTKLLADAGADVVIVESAAGHQSRRDDPGLFAYLHTSKRSVGCGTEGPLVDTAEIVVASADFDVAAARRRAPAQVIVTITPFGSTGPWAGRPATEFTMQAACGSTGGRGLPGQAPLAAGGGLGEWLAGTYAGVGALAACIESRRSGAGGHVDVAVFDCMAIGMVTFPSVFADFAEACHRPPPIAGARRIEVPSIEPTMDGWVTFTTNSAQQFGDLAVLIGRPDAADDDRYIRAGPRFANRESFWEMLHGYTRRRTSAQVLEEAMLLRIPVAPVLDGAQVMDFAQFAGRGVFVDHPSGRFRQPRVPYRLDDEERRPFRPVPDPAADDGTVDWPSPTARTPAPQHLPLAGTRVVDLTAWWAGPSATQALGCLGADVIKVESVRRPDLMRYAGPQSPDDPQWCEWGPLAHAANTNKRGVTIDLTRPEGHELVLRLLQTADLVIENYTPRVMEQFGLGWDILHRLNPRLSMIRMPAFGLDGPWRDHPGFAQTMESLTGLAWATGRPDGPPVLVGGAGDPVAGMHAAFSAMLALEAREADGVGHLVESTMVEAVLNAAAPLTIGYQLTGVTGERRGNRSPSPGVWQGVYACRGEDVWVAIAADGDEQQRQLLALLGTALPAPPDDLDALDDLVAGRTITWDADDLVEQLVAIGVPAATVIAPRRVADNPQILHRGLFETEHHPVTGAQRMPGLPFRMSGVDAWLRRPAPLLGQHNDEVFRDLGVDDETRQALRSVGIIGEALVR